MMMHVNSLIQSLTQRTFYEGHPIFFAVTAFSSFLSQAYWCTDWASKNVLATDISQRPPAAQVCIFRFADVPVGRSPFLNQRAKSMRNRELKKCLLCPCVSIDLSDTAVWKKDCSSSSKHCFVLGHWSKPQIAFQILHCMHTHAHTHTSMHAPKTWY